MSAQPPLSAAAGPFDAFVARAPEEVVDEQRARLEEMDEELGILRAAAGRLAAL